MEKRDRATDFWFAIRRIICKGEASRGGGVFQVRAEDGDGYERAEGTSRVGEGLATNHARRQERGFIVPAEGVGGGDTKDEG